ncbi:CgeB family protein [Pedobacter jejuensis]|uniref:Lipopolysaccharide biosynthesis protein n=1 Tax=Pedobacter jejuensis TaxID=1268550 RepID=A0A3N0C2X9_9SPHI|nr:lipopolysaccharide biosynthesis protein [Pedobacter jejuensis]RNL56912.1 lipopolysaccharide biosynthesis protein [Pedobacter jejuensis]
MDNLKGKSILLLSPKFFNYEIEIVNALKVAGASVVWIDERPSNTFFTKAIIRLNKNFLKRKIKNYYNSVLKQISDKQKHFDFIFIISPETLTPTILTSIKTQYLNAKVILYMWDSFKNKGALELLPLVDRAISFDKNDAQQYDLSFRALFYIDAYKKQSIAFRYDLLFTGTAHSDRYNFVKRLVAKIPELNVKLFFYLSSKKLFWAKKLSDKEFKSIKLSDISFIPLNHKTTADLVHRSKIILDINHPNQVGLTMRTLETLGAQKKLITTNSDIVNYDFYNENNFLLIDRENPVMPNTFINSEYVPTESELLIKYSIHGWVCDVFQLNL